MAQIYEYRKSVASFGFAAKGEYRFYSNIQHIKETCSAFPLYMMSLTPNVPPTRVLQAENLNFTTYLNRNGCDLRQIQFAPRF